MNKKAAQQEKRSKKSKRRFNQKSQKEQTPVKKIPFPKVQRDEDNQSQSSKSPLKGGRRSRQISGASSQQLSANDFEDLESLAIKSSFHYDASRRSLSLPKFLKFIKNIGGYWILIILIPICLLQNVFMMYSNYFLEDWSKHFESHFEYTNLWLYTLLWLFASAAGLSRKVIEVIIWFSLSVKLHSGMIRGVLHAKIQKFFGRLGPAEIQARFTQNLQTIDNESVQNFSFFLNKILSALVLFVTIALVTSYHTLALILLWIVTAFWFQTKYIAARTRYRFLEFSSKQPILSLVSDTLNGLHVIRAIQMEEYFTKRFEGRCEELILSSMMGELLRNWFRIRISLAMLFLIQLPTLLAILYFYKSLDIAQVGLFFICLFDLSGTLNGLLTLGNRFQVSLMSVERCSFFQKLAPEKGYTRFMEERKFVGRKSVSLRRVEKLEKERYEAENTRLKALEQDSGFDFEKIRNQKKSHTITVLESVVTKGELVFENVSTRYHQTDSLCLKNLEFKVNPAEKIGIIGRSGAGKSTLLRLIWKYTRLFQGRIFLDGKNLTSLDSKAVRSQLTVISDDTTIFEGSLKSNLDPTGTRFSEAEMTSILAKMEFTSEEYKESGLGMFIEQDGANLDSRDVVLLTYARAFLKPSKLVLIDTHSGVADARTEKVIQECIAEYFKDSTVLMVADSVQKVMDCQKILVLSHGEMADFDRPEVLMKRDGLFNDIVKKMKIFM